MEAKTRHDGRGVLKLRIRNFKSVKSAELRLKPGLNILIGPNGSGKTNLLSALKFIRDLFAHGAGLAIAKGGGARRNYHRDMKQISFQIDTSYGERSFDRRRVPHLLRWCITISQRGPEQLTTITSERLTLFALPTQGRQEVFSASLDRTRRHAHSHVGADRRGRFGKDLFKVAHIPRRRRKDELIASIRDRVSDILKAAKPNGDRAFLPRLFHIDDTLTHTADLFLNLNEYNILPDVARQAADQLPVVEMLPDGRNLGEVIHTLEQRNFHRLRSSAQAYEDMAFSPYKAYWSYPNLRFVSRSGSWSRGDLRPVLTNINRELGTAVSPIESVSVEMDPTSGKRFVVFKAGKHKFYPEEVSDGTIKWLCILVSIYVPFSRVYLLEEPENFLHPWMQQKLIRIMREQALKNRTIFLLTSHSATVLNAADIEEILLVRSARKGTVISPVQSRDQIRRVLSESNFGLGDLWVSGAIGGVPADT